MTFNAYAVEIVLAAVTAFLALCALWRVKKVRSFVGAWTPWLLIAFIVVTVITVWAVQQVHLISFELPHR